ncbi:MAG: thiamine phosphate synthase [Gemmatimonadota bacterium]|nr:thiamine phosphate synthase [Gemmatimonadota bacterium]MDH3366772.1 thiamine phosphate synthase [Gemmatimonadota bacterium]MDH3479384.1 thiamine phosphate synthase [Gemmatimonadota bacterium]MDH3569061.1 thiamine phosphate synthase [Gemmatimonadota bacterium]MDH5548896.1 thiamine phosphate synthase [Gemmatimonadota bacterium]
MKSELRLLAIVGPPVVELVDVVDACHEAIAGGVTAVQLRAKGTPAGALVALARQLCATVSIPVWVNDRADVALAAGARGVHVGADDLTPAAIRALAGDALRVGMSVGDHREAENALASAVDYWSVGAIYHTGTKPDAGTPIGPEGFRALAALAPSGVPVMAIGGISPTNVTDILAAGACGVAVSSAIFGAPNVRDAARELREIIDATLR